MPSLTGSLRLDATGRLHPEAVWSRYTEPARWPTWAPHLREVDYPLQVVEPGTSGRVTTVGGLVAVFRVDSVDHEARTWSWSVRTGPLRLALDHGVEEHGDDDRGDGGGSRAWLVTRALWPVAAGYAPVARWSLQRLVTP